MGAAGAGCPDETQAADSRSATRGRGDQGYCRPPGGHAAEGGPHRPRGDALRRLEQLALWGGVAAPVLYLVIALAGGAAVPGYDPVTDPISALTATGGPGIKWIEAGFGLYNLLLVAFAVAGWSLADAAWRRVFATLMVTASAGLLMWPFAMDRAGAPMSAAGLVHIGLAGLASLSTIVAVWLSIVNWHRGGPRVMARFGAACLVVIALSGVAAAVAAAAGWPLLGLLERVTIGGFLCWLAGTAGWFATTFRLAPGRSAN